MLKISNINKSYGYKKALTDFSLLVEKGEVCGIFGVNGAGKSTLFKIISGLEKADSGEIFFDEKDILNNNFVKIGSMIEKPAFFDNMSGYQNLELLACLSENCKKSNILNALKETGLFEVRDDLVRTYSLGMKQRLYFASAIMRDVEILLLDEPFEGIDPIGLFQLEKTIINFAKKENKIVLISSHKIKEIQDIIDQAIFIDKGFKVYDEKAIKNIDLFTLFIEKVSKQNNS